MLDPAVVARNDSRLTLTTQGRETSVDLYSEEGLRLLANLWVKVGAQFKVMYEPTWMNVPVIQFPGDLIAMQELLWRVKPDLIIECGIAHGGSLVFYAGIQQNLGLEAAKVLGIDIDIRPGNRAVIEAHPMHERIELIESSSTDPGLIERLRMMCKGFERVLVVLDSDHSARHVADEIAAYKDLVTPGSYLVVTDGAQGHVWDIPRGNPAWRQDNPLTAIQDFLARTDEYRVDPHYTRFLITSNPSGYLRRLTAKERASGMMEGPPRPIMEASR